MNYNFDEIIDRTNSNSVKYDLRETIFKTDDVIPMWVADMDIKTPDFIINAIKKRLNHEILGYTFRGEEFNNSVISWMKKIHNWEIKNNWISFSPGVVPAINMSVLAFTDLGDKIIVQPPVYFPFFSAIKDNKRIMLENQLKYEKGVYTIDFQNLESLIDDKVKMIILSSPHNPVGRVWTKTELIRLAKICTENNILILSDEIHSDLIFDGYKHIPLASLSSIISDITITCIAPSKTFNITGLSSSAVIISNEKLLDKYNKILDTLHLGMGNIFGLVALKAAYNDGEEWLNQLMQYLAGNVSFVRSFLENNMPEVKLVNPESTYLLWLDFSKLGLSNKELNKILINKAKVGLSDGRVFGKGGEGFQRMNIACPRSVVEKAMLRIKNALKLK